MRVCVGGGKGGVGKSTIATLLAIVANRSGRRVLLVDVDVESPTLHMLLGVRRERLADVTCFVPRIDPEACLKCGRCVNECPEHALVKPPGGHPLLLEELCSGCKKCYYVCPARAIEESRKAIGVIYFSRRAGLDLLQGELIPGEKKNIDVSREVVERALSLSHNYDLVIFDCPPGTSAAVWLAARESDAVVAVTEPTPLGLSDLKAFVELVSPLEKPIVAVLNRADLPSGIRSEVREFCEEKDFPLIEVPVDVSLVSHYMRCDLWSFSGETLKRIENLLRTLEEVTRTGEA